MLRIVTLKNRDSDPAILKQIKTQNPIPPEKINPDAGRDEDPIFFPRIRLN